MDKRMWWEIRVAMEPGMENEQYAWYYLLAVEMGWNAKVE